MNDILHQIVAHKRLEVAESKRRRSMEELALLCSGLPASGRSARAVLEQSPTGIMAEFKRRSPSKGWIHCGADAVEVVEGYERAGASVCSILTDESYFGGTLADLEAVRQRVKLPLLRKEFIVDRYQLYEAKLAGADVVLLIAACLPPHECEALAQEAHALGMEVLLEVHGAEELNCLSSYVDLLGVNNRNLGTFHTDVDTSFRMVDALVRATQSMSRPPLLVSESGLDSPSVVARLRTVGFRGFLMGETFMKTSDPAAALSRFVACMNEEESRQARWLIKVCGMRNQANVDEVEQLPVDLMGFVFHPQSPRCVTDNVPSTQRQNLLRVGVFVNENIHTIADRVHRHRLDVVQLHGDESPALCRELRQQGVTVIKALQVASAHDLDRASAYHSQVDLLLFDTRCTGHGGSGRSFDWSLLDAYGGPTPFLLSGGIGPDSIEALIRFHHPLLRGIDLNSRFESEPGVKQTELLNRFLSTLKKI